MLGTTLSLSKGRGDPEYVEGSLSERVDEAVLQCVDDELGGLVDTQRVHDVGAMHGDGVHAEVELGSNLAIREPITNQLEHFCFARSQTPCALARQWRWLDDCRDREPFRRPRHV